MEGALRLQAFPAQLVQRRCHFCQCTAQVTVRDQNSRKIGISQRLQSPNGLTRSSRRATGWHATSKSRTVSCIADELLREVCVSTTTARYNVLYSTTHFNSFSLHWYTQQITTSPPPPVRPIRSHPTISHPHPLHQSLDILTLSIMKHLACCIIHRP